ncbi:MAG: DUF924 domain-containing protein [Oligoflexia bacterium]|nr:DUF924 domain-containing protein [Oligoflexia bacterium]
MKNRPDEILEYWFGADPKEQTWNSKLYFKARIPLWFDANPAVDAEIRERFGADVEQAARGNLEHWREDPRGALALTLLLDQFSMNIHRGAARSFLQSTMAVPIAREAIERGFDQKVGHAERVFFYLPFEHAEELGLQEKSMELFNRLLQDVPPQLRETFDIFLDYAIRHHDVIRQFGRFPERNAVFGRVPTPAESRFLEQGGSPF